jgi:tRNA A37 threonylcarbamoyladenosine dehydratase
MQKIRNATVVVVGVGGVGSHAAQMLVRGGIGSIRLIDFDQVTLSSLNRHAVATIADVGIPKVICMATHLRAIVPQVIVDPIARIFKKSHATELLLMNDGQKPDFVVDCIDNVEAKVDLLAYCVQNGIPVISSMGAGAKADPTRIHLADISETSEDPLARAVRGDLRRNYEIDQGIPVLYSSERAIPGMSLIKPNESDPSNFAPLPSFRASIIPVLGPIPAAFGCSIAAHVLCRIANWGSQLPLFSPRKSTKDAMRILRTLPSRADLTTKDVALLMDEIWSQRSVISLLVRGLTLIQWNPHLPFTVDNAVLMTKEEAKKHSNAALQDSEPSSFEKWSKTVYGSVVVHRVESGLRLARDLTYPATIKS